MSSLDSDYLRIKINKLVTLLTALDPTRVGLAEACGLQIGDKIVEGELLRKKLFGKILTD